MLPAGSYYVGDLCYVMDDDEWDEVVRIVSNASKDSCKEYKLSDGRQFAIYSTQWGDGVYNDQKNREYFVDSGTIGCIFVSDLRKQKPDTKLGNIVTFEETFKTGKVGSKIKIGNITIDTS